LIPSITAGTLKSAPAPTAPAVVATILAVALTIGFAVGIDFSKYSARVRKSP